MRVLVAFYSRTGNTARVAGEIATGLGADVDRIIYNREPKGILARFRKAPDAESALPEIAPPEKNPGSYDLVVVGTPIWGARLAQPVRAYLAAFAGGFPELACFATSSMNPGGRAFAEMAGLVGKPPRATLVVHDRELRRGLPQKVPDFIRALAGPHPAETDKTDKNNPGPAATDGVNT